MPSKHTLKTPYPWFGGKKMVAETVWERFGDVANYVEPFFGGGAMLLNRPAWHTGRTETVNDINAWLTNFWRAVKADPDAVAYYASDPVNELDLHSRGDWLFYRRDYVGFVEAMRSDPEYYDAKSAGWWVWGQCAWIGTGWGRMDDKKQPLVARQLPRLSGYTGVNRQLPHTDNVGAGITDTSRKADITRYMRSIAERVSKTYIVCGDWKRVTSDTITVDNGLTGMFLDPPYIDGCNTGVYGENNTDVRAEVREYAIANGDRMRIALCCYEGEHEMPATWECYRWKANGGYASQGDGKNNNCKRETIWFSPMCLKPNKRVGFF